MEIGRALSAASQSQDSRVNRQVATRAGVGHSDSGRFIRHIRGLILAPTPEIIDKYGYHYIRNATPLQRAVREE